jgi:hypothetical protein
MRLFKRYVITSAGAGDWRLAEVRIETEESGLTRGRMVTGMEVVLFIITSSPQPTENCTLSNAATLPNSVTCQPF